MGLQGSEMGLQGSEMGLQGCELGLLGCEPAQARIRRGDQEIDRRRAVSTESIAASSSGTVRAMAQCELPTVR